MIKKWTPAAVIASLLITLGAYLFQLDYPVHYVLIAVTVVGLLPFVKEMVSDVLMGNFGVDLIAITGITAGLAMGEYAAAALILLMLSGGELLEDLAIKTAKKEVSDLVNNVPTIAHLKKGQHLKDVTVDDVPVGSLVVVKPNEVIPLDGIVENGTSSVDEANLTGESLPVHKNKQSQVFSGTTNQAGILTIKTTAGSKQTKYAQIIELIKEAEEHKAPFVRLADRYSVVFTVIAFTIAGGAWLLSGEMTRALAVLVVATPCPLILATPTAFAAGISRAAKRGIIIKDAGAIEKLATARTMLFDKTGTVTLGVPTITEVKVLRGSLTKIISAAASLEQFSVHILAKAFTHYAQQHHLPMLESKAYKEVLGKGVSGTVAGQSVLVGSQELLAKHHVRVPAKMSHQQTELKQQGVMVIWVAIDQKLSAIIHITDTIRPEMKSFFQRLTKVVSTIILVTGDKQAVAEHVAQEVGISHVIAECLPEDKVAIVKKYQQLAAPVVMVGDGVNDAPALAAADVGIALGGKESTAATQVGDIIVMVNGLHVVKDALAISRRVMKIALQSIWVGIGLSILLMILSSLGYIPPVYGAFLQEVIDVIVIVNALRARTGSLEL